MLTSPTERSSFRRFVFALLASMAIGIPGEGSTQVSRTEIMSFQSTTLTDQEFLTGGKGGKPVTLAGSLRLPRSGTNRLPVILLLHGSGGINGAVTDWETDLNAMGVATFVLDSFWGRGIDNAVNDQTRLGRLAMIVDAYRALELLARHPRIDPARIAVMGSSRGGVSALYASMKRFQQIHAPAGQEFAAYLSLYPDCGIRYQDEEDVSDKPMRLFHGSQDEWNLIAPCRSYVERLRAKGKDVKLIEYPDAGHVFDWQALNKPVRLDKAQKLGKCPRAEGQDGTIIDAVTKQPFTHADSCVEYGTTIAYNEKASSDARRDLKEFLTAAFKLQ